MGSNYQKGLYNQLMEVMACLDTVEKEGRKEISRLNTEISGLKEEDQLLRDDNERMKSILNNDSSNPPSTDQKGGKPVNTYNGRQNIARKTGGRKGTKARH